MSYEEIVRLRKLWLEMEQRIEVRAKKTIEKWVNHKVYMRDTVDSSSIWTRSLWNTRVIDIGMRWGEYFGRNSQSYCLTFMILSLTDIFFVIEGILKNLPTKSSIYLTNFCWSMSCLRKVVLWCEQYVKVSFIFKVFWR